MAVKLFGHRLGVVASRPDSVALSKGHVVVKKAKRRTALFRHCVNTAFNIFFSLLSLGVGDSRLGCHILNCLFNQALCLL